MKFDPKEVQRCISKADEITAHYKLNALAADSPERSVDYLKLSCEAYLGVKITIKVMEIDAEHSPVLGAYFALAEKGHYDVCVVRGLEHAHERFVLCKELFHVILDDPDHYNLDLAAHIEEVTLAFPIQDSSPGAAVRIEILSEVSAMEFLFPYEERFKELNGPLCGNYREIADKYKLPQVHIERYLSDKFMEELKPFCAALKAA
jgi:hypothetical protein